MIEAQYGRALTSREISALQRHTEATGEGPLDAQGVVKDPGLITADGRREYMASRLQDESEGESNVHSWNPANDQGGEGE